MPRASDTAAIAVTPGCFRSMRDAIDDVLVEIVEPGHATFVAAGLLEYRHVAEHAMRCLSRLVWRQALFNLLGDELFESETRARDGVRGRRRLCGKAIAAEGARP
jgi:hypothetical protein